MSLGYRTATGAIVALSKITSERFVSDGAPTLKLSGREYAAMTTGRVLRAAQSHFEFPALSAGNVMRAGRAAVASDELAMVVGHKNFDVFEDGESHLLRMVYREMVLRLQPDVSPRQRNALLKRHGLKLRAFNAFNHQQLVVYDNAKKRSGAELVELALELGKLTELVFATPNFISQYRRSATATATSAAQTLVPSSAQWHLARVRARQAWALSKGKPAITVAVLDDGVDVDHPELKANLRKKPDPAEPRDLLGRDFFMPDTDPDHFNPRPKRFQTPFDQMAGNDIHGTPCAGVAVGRGPRGFGLAPRCRLLPVKIFHADDLAADAQVADAIRYAGAFADVLSCSWSGSDSPDLASALADVARTGRGGKGAVVVCATGNDSRQQVSYPARDPNCIGVGASTDADQLASYSNSGPEVWVVAPSNGGAKGIFTTDVATSGRGFNVGSAAAGGKDGLFTNTFGGTSSATPLVAGLAALMLSVDPQLTVAQVRQHLADSARKIGPAAGYDAQGHSPRFGHGCIDALQALKLVKAAKS